MKRMLAGVLLILMAVSSTAFAITEVVDSSGRTHTFSEPVTRMICSGAGCLRLATYLKAQHLAVGVDDIETRRARFDTRPYALANPFLKEMPVFGGFRGRDDPEKVLGLTPQPQVIFKTYPASGTSPALLEEKTGIPVVTLEFGDLSRHRDDFYKSLSIMGEVLGRQKRAREVIAFFEEEIKALNKRTQSISPDGRRTCFVGGIAFRGPHGFASTEPWYPPFQFVHGNNVARGGKESLNLRHSLFSKEQLLMADPEVLFLDLSTLQMGKDQGGLFELKNDPVYRELSAVKGGRVFGVLPYNWYTQNMGSILADAWFIGMILYPEKFKGVDPKAKADSIYSFLVDAPVFEAMDKSFGNMAFRAIPLSDGIEKGEGHAL